MLTSELDPAKEYAINLGIMVGSSIEYKKLGLFTFEHPEINDGQNRYKGYDRMMYKFNMLYSTALTGAHKTSEYMAEIARLTGVPFVSALEDITITMLPGYTYREVIGYIAALHGANAIINDDGNLEFRWYTQCDYSPAHIYMGGITYGMTDDYTLNMIKCTVTKQTDSGSEDVTYTSGTGSTGISINNPFMTQALLDSIYAKIGGLVYRPMTVSFSGDVLPELGDIVKVVDSGLTYKCPIMQMSHDYDGGIKTEIVSVGSSASEYTKDTSGPLTKAMERYYADLVLINDAFVTKLTAQEAKIDKLDAEKITVSYLDAHYANLQLTNIEAGSIKTAMIATGAIETAQIADGSITDAKIVSLTANKLSAGTIDASKIEVTNLNCANLTVGTINGQQIASGAVDMSKLGSDMTSWITSTDSGVNKALADAGIANTNATAAKKTADSASTTATAASKKADTAQSTADSASSAADSAGTKADNAVSIANGKNTAYYQTSQPTGGTYKVNDNWFDTDDGYRMYYWNGSKWMATEYGASAIAANAITADKIAASAITAGKIAAGAITADKIAANAVTANKIASNAITADKLSVASLSAISANLGAITSGSLNIGSGNFVVDTAGNLTNKGTMSIGNGGITYTPAGGLSVFGDIKVKNALKMYFNDTTGAYDGKEHYFDVLKITINAEAPYLDVMSIFTEGSATFNGGLATAAALSAGSLTVSGGSTLIGNVTVTGKIYPNGGIYANDGSLITYDFTYKRWAMYCASGKGWSVFDGVTFSAPNFATSGYVTFKTLDGSSGRYGIGTVSANKQRVSNFGVNASGALVVKCQSGTGITYGTHKVVDGMSDQRLKCNISDCNVSALPIIDKIRLRSFDWVGYKNNRHQNIGFIADEIEMVDPYLSDGGGGYNEDGSINIKSVDTFYLQGYEVKAIQELHQMIKMQQQMIYNLQFELAKLQA